VWYLSILAGPRDGPCLLARPAAARQAEAHAGIADALTFHRCQPAVIQTDRGACFVGADTASAAVPGRLTLWLWGLGIRHRLTPPRRPTRNGAVERFHGAVEHSWQGEADGLAALVRVWNVDKAAPDTGTPYRGRVGFSMDAVWDGLAGVTVTRRVDRQGKLSLWDRPVRIGREQAQRVVTLRFDAARRRLLVHDEWETVVRAVALPWLTEDWLWEPVAAPTDAWVTPHVSHSPSDTSTVR
jgi:hypothetical protein